MRFTRKAPRGFDVREKCRTLTLTADEDSDVVLITAIMKFVCNDVPGNRRVADVSRALTEWMEVRP